MLTRENKGFFSLAFDSAHVTVKYGVWTWPKSSRSTNIKLCQSAHYDRIMKRSAFELAKFHFQVKTKRELCCNELIKRAEVPVSQIA